MLLLGNVVINWLNKAFHQILLLLDGGIYWAVSQAYQIFIKLADARIFEDSFYSNFAKRIYAILGVVMLFYLAYALLTAIVDPDKATQGDKSLGKLAQNIVISLVILGLLPTLFDYAYRLQGIIFKENIIGSIIFGVSGGENDENIKNYGNYMAYTALNPFLNPGNFNVSLEDNYSWYNLKSDMLKDGKFTNLPIMADWAVKGQKLISDVTYLDGNETKVLNKTGEVVNLDYKPGLSTVMGIILLYLIASFCLDLGVRVIKFAFCQLIAPIPVIMRMVPGKKGTFEKWLKLTLTVYFEVFIRVGIMYMVVYFFSSIVNNADFSYGKSGIQGLVVLAIILLGLITFAKQAPKMLGDILGLDSGNIKLGIKDKLKAGGVFAAGALAGGAVSAVAGGALGIARNAVAGGRNFINRWKENKQLADQSFRTHKDQAAFENNLWNTSGMIAENAKAYGAYAGLVGKTVLNALGVGASTVAGGASGLSRTAYKAKKGGVKNIGDIGKYAGEGATASEMARVSRDARVDMANEKHPKLGSIPVVGGILSTGATNIDQAKLNVSNLVQGQAAFTLTESEQSLKNGLTEFMKLVSARDDLIKKENAYIDAETELTNARVEQNMAANSLSGYQGATGRYVQELQRILTENRARGRSESLNSSAKRAYENLRNGGMSADDLKTIMDANTNKISKEVEKHSNASQFVKDAEARLNAVEQTIKQNKQAAYTAKDDLIQAFRDNHPEFKAYIGSSNEKESFTTKDGSSIDVAKVNKSLYVNEINALTRKEDTLRQKKSDSGK